MKKLKIICFYIVALTCVIGVCVSGLYIVRGQYNKRLQNIMKLEVSDQESAEYIVSELAALLERSYFFSDKMMLDAYTKLDECYMDKKPYLSTVSSCLYSIYFAEVYKDTYTLGESINKLADCCLVFDSKKEAEELYKQTLMLTENSPELKGEISARAHWGLAKVYAEIGTKSQALDHTQRSIMDAPEGSVQLYKCFSDLIEAEIQYKQMKYTDCKNIITRLEENHPAEVDSYALEYTLPVLALKGLLAVQDEDYPLGFDCADKIIELGLENELYSQVGDYLGYVKNICGERGVLFPEKYDSVIIDCYKTNAKRGTAFITQYSVLKYSEFTSENKIHLEVISHLAWIVLFLVFIVLNTILKLYMKSYTDALTGLYNKGAFSRRYHSLQRRRRCFGLIMMDVDDFKTINDSNGHKTGDRVLVRFSKQLEKNCRHGCTAYRVGGEEFCILIKNIKKSPPYEIAENIRAAAAGLVWQNGIKVTISSGVAIGKSRDLYKEADRRLYISKKNGKNQVN